MLEMWEDGSLVNIAPQSSMALLRSTAYWARSESFILIVVEDYYKITLFIGLVLIVPELCDIDCGCG